ncbi:unnamed protein product [Cylindrotheca closterium]|uniref:Uncharacterized protein n=1 Tax=Cylindrotheca closterium TaxID=2856 RepID=A0AAD2CIH8_9STRA|nr:unnamed protein product [Cylindrotheca closterium]
MIDVQSVAELSNHGLEHGLATIETKVEVLNAKMQDLDAAHGILILGQQEIQEVKKSLEVSMASLCENVLPGILAMKEEYYEDPRKTLGQRVQYLENQANSHSVGTNLLSSLSNTGSVDRRGLAIGGSANQLDTVVARLEQLDMANASLREEVARLTADAASQPELSPAPLSAICFNN